MKMCMLSTCHDVNGFWMKVEMPLHHSALTNHFCSEWCVMNCQTETKHLQLMLGLANCNWTTYVKNNSQACSHLIFIILVIYVYLFIIIL